MCNYHLRKGQKLLCILSRQCPSSIKKQYLTELIWWQLFVSNNLVTMAQWVDSGHPCSDKHYKLLYWPSRTISFHVSVLRLAQARDSLERVLALWSKQPTTPKFFAWTRIGEICIFLTAVTPDKLMKRFLFISNCCSSRRKRKMARSLFFPFYLSYIYRLCGVSFLLCDPLSKAK